MPKQSTKHSASEKQVKKTRHEIEKTINDLMVQYPFLGDELGWPKTGRNHQCTDKDPASNALRAIRERMSA